MTIHNCHDNWQLLLLSIYRIITSQDQDQDQEQQNYSYDRSVPRGQKASKPSIGQKSSSRLHFNCTLKHTLSKRAELFLRSKFEK